MPELIEENLHAIKRWTRPDNYTGENWPEYFVFLGQSRDSNALERSNFRIGLGELGGESETVHVVREGHWAVGWVEWIAIHQDNPAAVLAADQMLCALSDYPVLNDEDFSELELEDAALAWEQMPIRYRVKLCAECGISIFAARHDSMPQDPDGRLTEKLI